jgi:hypothetical protein
VSNVTVKPGWFTSLRAWAARRWLACFSAFQRKTPPRPGKSPSPREKTQPGGIGGFEAHAVSAIASAFCFERFSVGSSLDTRLLQAQRQRIWWSCVSP